MFAYVFKLRQRIEKGEGFGGDFAAVEAGVAGGGVFQIGKFAAELWEDGCEVGKPGDQCVQDGDGGSFRDGEKPGHQVSEEACLEFAFPLRHGQPDSLDKLCVPADVADFISNVAAVEIAEIRFQSAFAEAFPGNVNGALFLKQNEPDPEGKRERLS